MKKWEYRVESYFHNDAYERQADLDRLGAEGWELVSVDQSVAYLKRELEEEVLGVKNLGDSYDTRQSGDNSWYT